MSKVSVRLLIDKEQQRVVIAEAGSNFIDVLFSFLTLPLGSIVRLLGKQSGLGSLDSLYESVEKLDEKYLQTEACKQMLLNPRSAAAIICEDLKIENIHDANPRDFYVCNSSNCLVQSTCYYSFAEKSRCSRCGLLMTKKGCWPKNKSEGGIFVNETIDFLVTDNLRVIPTSLMGGCSLLKEMGIKDVSTLEERVIDFGTEEALNLLRRSLVSKNPLTEVCFPDACKQASANCSLAIKEEMNFNEEESETTTLKLVLNKKKNVVLYAEAGEHFVNQLLSVLAFPLGSVLRLLSDNVKESAQGGCISNLYSSVENMGIDCFKSEDCRNMLLTPKLATFYGFQQQMLNLEEITSQKLSVSGRCPYCYFALSFNCFHGERQSEFIEQNPKLGKAMKDNGGAYVLNSKRFMVADNLQVSPLSFISAISNEMNLPVADLVGKDVCLDKAKAMSLWSTMLISNTVLTDGFCPKPMRIRNCSF